MAPERTRRMAMPHWSDRLGKTMRAAERELEEAQYSGSLLDLTYADTHRFPPPEWTLEEFNRAASGGGMTYTPYAGDQNVREAVAANVSSAMGLPARASNVLLAPGTQAGLFTALSAIVEEGDEVLLADPEYLSTERMLHYLGARVTHIPLRHDGDGRASLDEPALREAAKREPKLLIFSNPNNPTGAVHTEESIADVARTARAHDMHVLVDQLYCRLTYEDTDFHHLASFEDMADRSVTLMGPSKTESMSGYRIGTAIAPPALIDRMEDILSITALRAPAYAQHLLRRWIADDAGYVWERQVEYQKLRDMAIERFARSDLIEVEKARGTAYLFPRCTADVSDQELVIALKERCGLVVNPGYQFGPRGVGHFRICFAQEEKAFESALESIVSTVDDLAAGR